MTNKHFTSMRDIAHDLARKHKISDKAAGEFLLQFVDITWRHMKAGHKVEIEHLGIFHYRYSTLERPPGNRLFFYTTSRLKKKLNPK